MVHENHKLAAIVFTDIVGYTRQMEENEQKTMQLLQQQREIVFPLVKEFGGEIIKEMGDGLMMMFGSAVLAVRFAIDLQTRLKDSELTIRAGIHIGDVVFRDGDVFGSAVNIAARIEPLAPPRGICISDDVKMQLFNKTDIQTIAMGRRELKGVRAPVEIHQVYVDGVTLKVKPNLVRMLKVLWERHVFQLTIAYILLAGLIVQAVKSIVSANLFSPYLVDLAWVVLASFLPTVILLTYFSKKSREENGMKFKRITPPANILFTIILSIILFQGKDLGSVTTDIVVENEDGQKITRTLLKSEFRKNIAIYSFENTTNDTSLLWLQYGIPILMEYDLSQDVFINTVFMIRYINKMKEAGFNNGLNLPFTLRKKLAEQYILNYFISGSFKKTGDMYIVKTEIFDTKTGRPVSEFTLENVDIFKLIDQQTLAIKQAIEIPEVNINKTTDLPVNEITTSSIEALKDFVLGLKVSLINNDFDNATRLLNEAVKKDPGFALAHFYLAHNYLNNNQTDNVAGSLEAVMENLYKLPEQQQFLAKIFLYIMQQEPEKALAVNQMWIDLFPDDITAHTVIAQRYQFGNQNEKAIRAYQTILHLDPSQDNYLLSIGNQFIILGNYDSALVYYQKFEKFNPQNPASYKKLGELYLQRADFAKARDNFEKACILEPNNVGSLLSLIGVNLFLEKPDKIKVQFQEALNKCSLARDSGTVYNQLAQYHMRVGQIKKAIEYNDNSFELLKDVYTPKDVLVLKTFLAHLNVIAGNPEKSLSVLKEIEKKFKPPIDKIIVFGYMLHYVETKQPEEAKKLIPVALEMIDGFGEQMLLPNVYYVEGKVAELEADYEKMLQSFLKYKELQPGTELGYTLTAGAYRKKGNITDAEENIKISLQKDPFNPKVLLEAALVYRDKKDYKLALEYISTANEIWSNADETYSPSIQAKELMTELLSLQKGNPL